MVFIEKYMYNEVMWFEDREIISIGYCGCLVWEIR